MLSPRLPRPMKLPRFHGVVTGLVVTILRDRIPPGLIEAVIWLAKRPFGDDDG